MVLGELLVLEPNNSDLQRTTVTDDVLYKQTGQRCGNNCSVLAFRMFHENGETILDERLLRARKKSKMPSIPSKQAVKRFSKKTRKPE
tara:strand:+ start:1143 stop:1406 length:264 start_codon:yes stop_codon:yes gene_type:complete